MFVGRGPVQLLVRYISIVLLFSVFTLYNNKYEYCCITRSCRISWQARKRYVCIELLAVFSVLSTSTWLQKLFLCMRISWFWRYSNIWMSFAEAEHGYASSLPMPEDLRSVSSKRPKTKKSQGSRWVLTHDTDNPFPVRYVTNRSVYTAAVLSSRPEHPHVPICASCIRGRGPK